jgi:hypothetical protein
LGNVEKKRSVARAQLDDTSGSGTHTRLFESLGEFPGITHPPVETLKITTGPERGRIAFGQMIEQFRLNRARQP